MMDRRGLGRLLGSAALFPAAARSQGAAYPDRPVRIVVPYAPGGANDILARLYGQKMSERLGQPFVVENRPGAQAIIGTEAVARSRPDGTTLLLGPSGPMVFNPATYAQLPYDPLRDLAPVSMLASYPLVLVVAASGPHRSLGDLTTWAKANPDRANYGAAAAAFQLPSELLNQSAGTRFQHVAYRGSAEMVSAAASGEVTFSMADPGPAVVALNAGRVRALAVTSSRRMPALPDVQTMAELGFGDLDVTLWAGLFAPAGTPAPIIERLHAECEAITAMPDIRSRVSGFGMDPVGGTPAALRETMAREITTWTRVSRAANIQMER